MENEFLVNDDRKVSISELHSVFIKLNKRIDELVLRVNELEKEINRQNVQ